MTAMRDDLAKAGLDPAKYCGQFSALVQLPQQQKEGWRIRQ